MTPDDVDRYLMATFPGLVLHHSWGERAYFYNPGAQLKRGVYMATIKEKDGENDRASRLDFARRWRLNIGVSKPLYTELFGPPPRRPAKGEVVEGPWDFAATDTLVPHPVYAWMGWVCVVSPSAKRFAQCQRYLADAYEKAKLSFAKRRAVAQP